MYYHRPGIISVWKKNNGHLLAEIVTCQFSTCCCKTNYSGIIKICGVNFCGLLKFYMFVGTKFREWLRGTHKFHEN